MPQGDDASMTTVFTMPSMYEERPKTVPPMPVMGMTQSYPMYVPA